MLRFNFYVFNIFANILRHYVGYVAQMIFSQDLLVMSPRRRGSKSGLPLSAGHMGQWTLKSPVDWVRSPDTLSVVFVSIV